MRRERFGAAAAKLQANALVEVPLCRVQWLYPLTILPLSNSTTNACFNIERGNFGEEKTQKSKNILFRKKKKKKNRKKGD